MIGMNTFGNKVDRTQQDMPTKHLIEDGFGPYSGFGGDGGIIYDMATDAQGKIYVCGEFFKYNGTTCSKLVRLNSDLTLDTTFNYQLGWGDSITETGRINPDLAPDGPAYPGYGVSGDYSIFTWQRVRHYNSTLDAVVHAIPYSEEYWATQAAPRSISILDNGNLVVGYNGLKNIEKRTRVEMGSEVPPTSQQNANFETFYHGTSTDQDNTGFGPFHPQEAANGTRMINWTYTNWHNRSSFFIVDPNTATMASDWDSFGWKQSDYGHTATVWDNTIWYNNDWKANISPYWDGEDEAYAKLVRAYHGFGDYVLKINGNSIFTKNNTPFNLSFKRWDCDTGNVYVMEPSDFGGTILHINKTRNNMAIDSRGHFFAVGGYNQDTARSGWTSDMLTAANGNLHSHDSLVEWDTNGALVQPQNRRFKSYISPHSNNMAISLEIDSNDNFYFIISNQSIVTNAWQDISRFASSGVLVNNSIEPYYTSTITRNPNTFAIEFLRINEKQGVTNSGNTNLNNQSFIVMGPTGNVITHKALVNSTPTNRMNYDGKWGDTMKYLNDQNLLIISTDVKRISTTNPASSTYIGAHVYLDKDGIEINNTDAYLEDAEDWAHNFLVWDIDNSTWMTEFFGDDRDPSTSSKVFSKRRVNSSDVNPRGVICATGNGPTGFVVAGDFSQYNDTNRNLLVGLNLQGEATSPIGRTEPWTPETSSSSPVAWIDASDSSNYTTSGTTLTSVTDKARTYTMDVGGTPTVVTGGLNSLNVFDFDGNEYLQSTTYEAQVSNGDHWAIGVFRFEGTDSTQDTLWSYETNQSIKTDYAISSGGSSNSWPGELDLDGLSSNRISTTIGNKEDWNIKSLVRNQYHIVACWFNKTGNQIGIRVDGSNAFTPVNDYDENIRQNQELRLMRNRSKQELDGKMGEFIAFATIPGTSGTDLTHLEKAEGYLAHKWGLTGSLPSNHAYKNTRPTT